ncbi:DUF6776 family protein [endosymbiont of Ridgeia piscesae]|jgi:hypothetical protein|uniref:Uncharacterized protein n=1 Tax=endosymbiont of Ridgeia piscesae TaxID=54398 RepID=A0A0T5YUQ4_9GAMM|nr:DUF6776 family protein [endosymbiont of Ridgeia piscesae]KRT53893.1 hypothetical protein Ga0074115_101229 [endosymbiont of Ridgeia piscesae]KRT58195.1 hypothetical protein Ga0076813_13022 [endosymbiont of Ridgeia piscesae]
MKAKERFSSPKIVANKTSIGQTWGVLLVLMLLAAAGWGGYQLGGERLSSETLQTHAEMQQQLAAVEAERNDLRRQLTMAEQAAQVDKEALASVKAEIEALQDERLKMEEELVFLRGIVSTSKKKEGLKVQGFKLEPGLEAGQFNYKFTVSQVLKNGQVAKGRILISVEGVQDGKVATYNLDALADKSSASIKMRFRYFQNVEGVLRLPKGFEPARLIIEVKPSGKRLAPVSESYPWSPVS